MSIATVTLVGRLGQDPVEVNTKKGSTLARISIATSESHRTESGEYEQGTIWWDVLLTGTNASFALEHLQKGALVMAEGKVSFKGKVFESTKNPFDIFGTSLTRIQTSPKKAGEDSTTDREPAARAETRSETKASGSTASRVTSSRGSSELARALQEDLEND